jgi:hypothetical protein
MKTGGNPFQVFFTNFGLNKKQESLHHRNDVGFLENTIIYLLLNPTGLPTRVIAHRKPNQEVDCLSSKNLLVPGFIQ